MDLGGLGPHVLVGRRLERGRDASPSVAVLLPAADVRGGFAAAAVDAAADLALDPELCIDVRYGHAGPPEPSWTAVLCHGGQWAPWIRHFDVTSTRRVVMTDRVVLRGPRDPISAVTMVDWHWDQAAYLAGALAASLVSEYAAGAVKTTTCLGLLAGPPVPTQRRVASAYVAGAHDAGYPGQVVVAYASAFDDVDCGDRLARLMTTSVGCTILAHAADAAGEEGCRIARELGAATIGFIEPLGDHVAVVDSNVRGVVTHLLTALAHDSELPGLVHAGLAAGYLDLRVRDPSLNSTVGRYRAAAALI